MMRFLTVIILIVLAYLIFRHLMRMLRQETYRRSERSNYRPQNGGYANTEEAYRKILGVTEKDTPETIKTRYKELLTKYHPDKVQYLGVEFQEMAEKKTKAIMEAYEFFEKKYDL
jgi:DnaJ-domain-containing protein 1